MKTLSVVLSLALGGCGGEVVGTAATSAAIKKQEIEQGNKTAAEMKKQITQSMEQSNARAREGDK